MNFYEKVKKVLRNKIIEMAEEASLFVRRPGIDFTRMRKLGFASTIELMITMEAGSLNSELLKHFQFATDTVTASAFIQQRQKILPEALEYLFHQFNAAIPENSTYHGYRLFACDGSAMNIAHNPKDDENYRQTSPNRKGYNQLHLNALYDICSRRYVDAIVQSGSKVNEYRAMTDMIDCYHSDNKTIFIADRGYESYNVFAHAENKGCNYLIRAKDVTSNGILSGFKVPDTQEFDITLDIILTRKQTNEVKASPQTYRFVPYSNTFDYLDSADNAFYPMSFRAVRFCVADDTYECVITNLPAEKFPPKELKKLYNMRWGIETSFRELKYAIGMTSFHAKKVEYIKQEIFARLLLYNFCEIIATHVIVRQKDTKHPYQLNYTMAIRICRYFLSLKPDIPNPDVEALICKFLCPVRPGRSFQRNMRPKAHVSFQYRTA